MFFKNLYVFAFTRPFTLTQQEVETSVSECSFTPLGSTEQSHFGWVNALGKHGHALAHESGKNLLLCARKEEKIIPAQVIKDMLEEKIDLLEAEQGRSATKKEREQFKEDIVFELLPRAFSRITETHGYLNPEHNIIVVNSSSRGKAEDFLALLRKSLGTLPVTSISPEKAPDEVMTEWVEGNLTGNQVFITNQFEIGMEAEFNALGDTAAIVLVKNMSLDTDEIKTHLDADMFITKIAIEYDDSMSFILNDDLSIKRLKFFDALQEQNDDIDSDDILAKLDADFALMSGELNQMLHSLFNEFSDSPLHYLDEN